MMAVVGAVCISVSRIHAAPPDGYYEVWGDEFNGSALDLKKWDYWLPGPRRDAVDVPGAVSVNGGNLVITTFTTNGVHCTAMVGSDNTFRPRYGYFEAGIKWCDTNGMWSAFWMQSPTMGRDPHDPAVSGSEIDIVEHRSTDGARDGDLLGKVQNNIHWNGYGASAAAAGSGNIGSGLGGGFHTYGFLWTPAAYATFIDGVNLREWSYENNKVPISQSCEWIILSSEVDDTSTKWAGKIPAGGYGAPGESRTRLMVDYVRYYAPTNTLFWKGAGALFWTNSASWVSNMQPGPLKNLTFSYLTEDLSSIPGADFSANSLVFLNTKDACSINGTNTLTLNAGGIDMAAADHSVRINCPVRIGADQAWRVGPNYPGNRLIVNGNVSGSGTLTKAGPGTLVLGGSNSFFGFLNVDSVSSDYSDGCVQVTCSAALANVASPISILDNNLGGSTLQLNGLEGNITIAQDISLSGRNAEIAALQNVSGRNKISGKLSINSGGRFYLLQSDSGTLEFAGGITAAPTATGSRTVTFQGAGDFDISGPVENGGAAFISLEKKNYGALTISGTNNFTGTVANFRGKLLVNGRVEAGVVVNGGALGGCGTVAGETLIKAGAALSPGGSMREISFGTNLVLEPGSMTILGINKTLAANDRVKVAGAASYSGTLVLTNLSGALVAGDSFQIFEAPTFNGNFSSIAGSPGAGLEWRFNPAGGMVTACDVGVVNTNK